MRDLDILIPMAEKNLVSVMISITATDEKLRSVLEPRTSTYANRFKAIQTLAKYNIPCGVMVAPIIPGLTDQYIPGVLKTAAENGAKMAGFTIVRLNDTLGPIFTQWLEKYLPDKKDKVLSLIRSCHQGQLEDRRPTKRFKGDGNIAEVIHQMFKVCYKKYFPKEYSFTHNCSLFNGKKISEPIQGTLF